MLKKLVLFFVVCISLSARAQSPVLIGSIDTVLPELNYFKPKEYIVADITVSGSQYYDKNVIKLLSGLYDNQRIYIPGNDISDAIRKLWKQNLFDDINISVTKIVGEAVFLNIAVVEKPQADFLSIVGKGVRKGEKDDVKTKIRFVAKKLLTDYYIGNACGVTKEFFVNKGYLDAKVDGQVIERTIDGKKKVGLEIRIDKGQKVKISEINFIGVTQVKKWKLRRKLKDTRRFRWYNPFNSGKYLADNKDADLPKIADKYKVLGYRDARVTKDSVYRVAPGRVNIDVYVEEGRKYYFRNIAWQGNTKYRSGQLDTLLGIKRGDVFDQAQLDAKLFMNPSGIDISSLYMDDGYLFFQVNPTEVAVDGDSIDLEMRMYEGKQATIRKVTLKGNDKTNDKVVMREIRTRPGQLFRRSDIMRTQRELAQLGFFDAEKLGVNPIPNQADGTVDIDYTVVEKPSDQVELSAGWGGGRLVGTLGLSFNNFSMKNIFRRESWSPLPTGDGQKLSLRAQSNGVYYQSYNLSFSEPWLGGKKPNSLSVSIFHTVMSNGQAKYNTAADRRAHNRNPLRGDFTTTGGSVGFGKRLKFPDDWFTLYAEMNYNYYQLNNYGGIFTFGQGYSNNVNARLNIARNSVDSPIFPRSGSSFSLTAQLTPPYSAFNHKNYDGISDQSRYKFIEYQKYKFTTAWYTQLTNQRAAEGKEARNLVLALKAGFGILGSYNSRVGASPFERFTMGGSGLTGFNNWVGTEIIALRGYDDGSISKDVLDSKRVGGDPAISKYTMELRYPISLNPQATVFVLGFAEAGNTWKLTKDFNPFDLKRSAGVGVRIFLPMFGLLGFDYGWGFDKLPNNPNGVNPKGQFHFTIGAQVGEL